MTATLQREWKQKLGPSLFNIRAVHGISIGQIGLVINLKYEDARAREAIDAVFEKECPDVPYVVRIIEGHKV